MKKMICSFVLAVAFALSMVSTKAIAAEANFNPNTQYYDMNSEGVLNLWGIPEANGNSVRANPDFGWPSEFVVAAWYATILKAHQMNMYVVVGYDPVTYDIWYVAKPRY